MSPNQTIRHAILAAVFLALAAPVASAQAPPSSATSAQTSPADPASGSGRTQQNVVRQAEDGFGTTIGRESIGIYTAGNVRGFSALAAGNARINGLYFDQVAAPSARIRQSTAIRVGMSSLAFPFQAPTGVVDYGLITPGTEATLSTTLSADTNANANLELDFSLPLAGERLSLGGGAAYLENVSANGSTSTQSVFGLAAHLRPTSWLEFQPFWTRTDTRDNRIGPAYSPAGDALPPRVPRGRFFGQDWAQFEGAAQLYGVLGKARPAEGWSVDLGVFRSAFLTERDTFVLIDDIQPDGSGRYFVFTDPSGRTESTSGELRTTRSFAQDAWNHRIIASLWARDRWQLFGGSDTQDFGVVRVGERVAFDAPEFAFGVQSRDEVRQFTSGIAYAGAWAGIGELGFGVSKTDYRKRVQRPDLPESETRSSPYLHNGSVAFHVTPKLAVFAGYARGLEESGVAPQSAINRNEALPAVATRQQDAGFRWSLADRLRLIGGVFEVRKPYFSRDADGLFTQLGDLRNRGIELSLSGALTESLRVVVGGVALDPEVTGEGVQLGRVGPRPVGLPRRKFDANFDWTTPVEGVSLDLRIAHQSSRPATTLNTVFLPDRTTVGIGGRYRFRLGGHDSVLRVSLSNMFDVHAYDLYGSGTYDVIEGRKLNASLVTDF